MLDGHDEPRTWQNGVCAPVNPARCCLSNICPCLSAGYLARKNGSPSGKILLQKCLLKFYSALLAVLGTLFCYPLMICHIRGKVREQLDLDAGMIEGKKHFNSRKLKRPKDIACSFCLPGCALEQALNEF
jgi:Cys-rich protein (TIGR01571 family)